MIKRMIAAAAAGTTLVIASGLTAASAATSSAASNGAAVTHFTASYSPDGVDLWTCSGAHVINKGAGTQDSETCRDTTGYSQLVGTYTGSPYADLPLFGPIPWFSDYNGAMATTWTITIKNDGYLGSDGFETYEADITAFYNS